MNVKELVSQMTLEEKAGMCSGADFWHLKGVERLGIPSVMVTDGPHGLRKQDQSGDHLGINDSVKAVCFPTASALACSFDRELLFELGKALGEECQAEDVSVILGPGANIKRSPLCGRNFEYFSEDPYLSSEMAASHISGVQSQNVGTSLKHFAANNQEHRRMTSSSEVDERTLREIYLASFEGAVKKGRPWTVMCSYNRINGVYASENHKLLTEILRDEWGFDGYVVSDWGAVNDRVEGLKAGLDLEMPSSGGVNDALIIKAVKEGKLDEKVLDRAVERILTIIFRYVENKKNINSYDKKAHHELARKISSECMVLLKNDGILPLKKKSKIAFIGKFAASPRYQGGGSSHINSFMVSNALEVASGIAEISYAKGYETAEDTIDENLIKEAVNIAKDAEVAVVFAGLPDKFESEGYDREHMSMPNCQNKLIDEICKVQPNTVVVLHNGSPVEMPWIDKVKAVLEVYLGGQAVGEATVDVLFGDKNPCGKLAESFPKRLEDNPSYLFFKGEKDRVEYREGVFVGYRYYDKKNIDVLFPFGHGLSYTTFEYSDLKLDRKEMLDTETLSVSVKIKNTGKVAGKEIVQLYVKNAKSIAIRPEKELKGFKKIELAPGEEKNVSFVLEKRAFAYYNTEISDWYVPTGTYQILIGKSSRDIILSKDVLVKSTSKIPVKLSLTSTVGDAMEIPEAKPFIKQLLSKNVLMGSDSDKDALGEGTAEMMERMMIEMPLRALVSFAGGALSIEDLQKTIDEINQKANKA
ncbi:MAG: glycoside hydrolase family 3 C-terminal domain-containing protein [Oscillospiraceae bacterium]|nr:glycoside hydrolase family 3 C-terminal domain-containing protein [Oscillospiraceae bacterium]